METSTALTLTAGTPTVAMPTDLLELRSLTITDGLSGALDAADLSTIARYGVQTGRPAFYTISGSNFRFGPIPDADYDVEVVYKAKIPALSDGSPTNWLLTDHPDIYLFASLIEACFYLNDEARVPGFAEKLKLALETLEAADNRAAWQAGPIASRVDFYCP
jgi:hypothetical protein